MSQVQYRSPDAYTFKMVSLEPKENTIMGLCKKIKSLEGLKDSDFLYILNADDQRRNILILLAIS